MGAEGREVRGSMDEETIGRRVSKGRELSDKGREVRAKMNG